MQIGRVIDVAAKPRQRPLVSKESLVNVRLRGRLDALGAVDAPAHADLPFIADDVGGWLPLAGRPHDLVLAVIGGRQVSLERLLPGPEVELLQSLIRVGRVSLGSVWRCCAARKWLLLGSTHAEPHGTPAVCWDWVLERAA